MRFPIPNRFQRKYVLLGVAFVFVGQIVEGTDPFFAFLTAVYNILWATAVNVAGGLEYPSGAFILSNGLYSVVLGLSVKVLLGQAGQRNLQAPITTMMAYCAGMTMILIVALLVRSLRPKQALIRGFDSLQQMKQASIACLLVGLLSAAILTFVAAGEGSFLSVLNQVDQGIPIMAIILATMYEIRRSGGKRSINWINGSAIGLYVFFGLTSFGKTALLLGFLAWVITAVLHGYDFKRTQIVSLLLGFLVFTYYLTPYSQYVRGQRSSEGLGANLVIALHYLSNLNETRRLYYESLEGVDVNETAHLYDEREGFLDRLIIVAADDELIHYTEQGNIFGISPTLASYANTVPRVLWRNKPVLNIGNAYAHELGDVLSEDDTTTGIAFSATADAFHQLSWFGLLTILPINLFLCFLLFDTVVGSVRYSAFGVLAVIDLFNTGSESGLDGVIHEATYGLVSMLVIVWLCKVAAPFLMKIILRHTTPPPIEGPRDQSRQFAGPAASGI